MKSIKLKILLIIVSFALFSCEKQADIKGQIFVVTKSAENYKMGGVEVIAISDEEFAQISKKMTAWLEEEIRKSNQNRVNALAVASITSTLEYASIIENLPEDQINLIIKNIKKESNIDSDLIRRAESISSPLSDDREENRAWNESLLELLFAQARVDYISSLSSRCLSRATTDADGRFSLPAKGKVWLVSIGDRSIGGDTECYLWIKSINCDKFDSKTQVVLSNNDVYNSSESLYTKLVNSTGQSSKNEIFDEPEPEQQIQDLVVRHWKEFEELKARKKIVSLEAKRAKAKAELEEVEQINAVAKKAEEDKKNSAAEFERKIEEIKTKSEKDTAKALENFAKNGVKVDMENSGIEISLSEEINILFVLCKPGAFIAESKKVVENSTDNESVWGSFKENVSVHDNVRILLSKAFWLGKTEITQAQWKSLVEKNPSEFYGLSRPVENVSWDDVQKFIKILNDKNILPLGWKFSLPTEAQWICGFLAGELNPSKESLYFSGRSDTSKVASGPANGWGLHDMGGNVGEWCQDWFNDKLTGGIDPIGSPTGKLRVMRNSTTRIGGRQEVKSGRVGFRIAVVSSD